jgi:predicted alpha/beta-hydrolase family hydrolase
MKRYARALGALGRVVPFDYPYMAAGRRRPDPLEKLIEAHRAQLTSVRQSHRGPVFLAGKSMGGRVGCHLALEEPVSGVICLGYPLKGMGKSGALRDQVLLDLRVPILFVQGTRDALCPLELLAPVRKRMKAKNHLFVVETGNHSLEATKTHLKAVGESQDEVEARILGAIRAFIGENT